MDVDQHLAVFNAAVTSGDWDSFVTLFAEDATVDFVGPPVGPLVGRDAIADAYNAMPPDDTMERIGTIAADGNESVVPYQWSTTGATGTLHVTEAADGRLAQLVVTFDA